MIDLINGGILPENKKSYSKENLEKNESIALKEEKSNSDIVEIKLLNMSGKEKESVFWGHFDLSLSEYFEDEFSFSKSSISMSLDVFTYNKNGISETQKEKLENIFNGKEFEEFKNTFFSLNGNKKNLNEFYGEVDDLFSEVADLLNMDEKLFEGSKKLFKFTALMYSNNINSMKQKDRINELMGNVFAVKSKLNEITGDGEKAEFDKKASLMVNSDSSIKEYLNLPLSNNLQNDLIHTLNRLSKLSAKYSSGIDKEIYKLISEY